MSSQGEGNMLSLAAHSAHSIIRWSTDGMPLSTGVTTSTYFVNELIYGH